MNWLSPIDVKPMPERPAVRRKDTGAVMPSTSRPVTVNGVEYPSMVEAKRELRCSYSKIYYAIGEGWRCKTRKKD